VRDQDEDYGNSPWIFAGNPHTGHGRESTSQRTGWSVLWWIAVAGIMVMLAALMTGCESINRGYVEADRATYEAIEPVTRGLMDGSIAPATVDAEERRLTNQTLDAWKFRLDAAEAK
jgi:hypothetical protein